MPNWIFSSATFSGTEEAVHKLIKIGLENSQIQSTGDLRQDFNLLVAEGKSLGLDKETQRVVMTKGLTARTFLPIPETYILYDTTNVKALAVTTRPNEVFSSLTSISSETMRFWR